MLNFIKTSRKKFTEYRKNTEKSGAAGGVDTNSDNLSHLSKEMEMIVRTFRDKCKIRYIRKQRGTQSHSVSNKHYLNKIREKERKKNLKTI